MAVFSGKEGRGKRTDMRTKGSGKKKNGHPQLIGGGPAIGEKTKRKSFKQKTVTRLMKKERGEGS